MVAHNDTSTRSWNRVADDWVAHADTNDYRNHYLMPRMLALLGDVRGKAILDLGCGEGGYARELARRGARVTGVDGSERLVEDGREPARDEGAELRFFKVDRYFERTAWDDAITPAFRAPVLRRHRPLEDYMAAPLECGFILRAFFEPSVTEEELARSHRFRKLARIPYFLFLR